MTMAMRRVTYVGDNDDKDVTNKDRCAMYVRQSIRVRALHIDVIWGLDCKEVRIML